MPDYTQYYNLIKPKKGENYDVDDTTCTNMDIIDTQLANKVEKVPGKGLSTNDFTNNYKNKIDTLQNIYRFMGAVDTVSDLPTTGQKNGDVYNVKSENKDYAWNDNTQTWVQLGSATNLDNVAMKSEIKINRSLITLQNKIDSNTNYTIPLSYQVGNDSLEVFYCTTKLQKGEDYIEVGENGSVSTTIQFLDDLGNLDMSDVEGFENFTETLEFIVRR